MKTTKRKPKAKKRVKKLYLGAYLEVRATRIGGPAGGWRLAYEVVKRVVSVLDRLEYGFLVDSNRHEEGEFCLVYQFTVDDDTRPLSRDLREARERVALAFKVAAPDWEYTTKKLRGYAKW